MPRLPELRSTRRDWLARNAAAAAAALTPVVAPRVAGATPARGPGRTPAIDPARAARLAAQAERLDPTPVEALGRRAVEAAVAAGASYADARLTRDVVHQYDGWAGPFPGIDVQTLGLGVRALVNGYWGFASGTLWDADEAARLAQEAVAIAKVNATGPARAVELGRYPAATGRWSTPVRVDPFTVSFEEKCDYMRYWSGLAQRVNCYFDGIQCHIRFVRQERTVATSEGTLVTQTLYESGAELLVGTGDEVFDASNPFAALTGTRVPVLGVEPAAAGWERLLDADIPGQLTRMPALLMAKIERDKGRRPLTVGAYTLVCDGVTMARMAAHTLGLATQLDRAMGYEANATGTSYLDDPLAMLGQAKVASPLVTLTADRSMEKGLATVKWDDEGVEPDTCTLVKDGVLTDFQTTRESSAWLKDYYAKAGKPVRSHGHLIAGAAIHMPLQQMPNVTLAPAPAAVALEDLVASARDGVYVEGGFVRTDFQAKNGMIEGSMRFIKNGRLGPTATDGAVLFSSTEFWKKVTATGGAATLGMAPGSRYMMLGGHVLHPYFTWWQKGQPAQAASHTALAPAAVVATQSIIDPLRKA